MLVMEISEEQESSGAEDLCEDIARSMGLREFSSKGSFYHASAHPSTPNPCLIISGLGLVGLPLTERGAKTLISNASLVSFEEEERNVVGTDVCNTWEIDGAALSFANEEWLKWVQAVACLEVCNAFGVKLSDTSQSVPRMELRKLLIHETGSHFLPRQNLQKSAGLIGNVVILLPSTYSGGQVIVSHWHTTEVLDLSSQSPTSTALLAWYADAKCELSPVTSGCRLALSYDLVMPSSSIPDVARLALPDSNETAKTLRHIFTKWKNMSYRYMPEEEFVGYILDHQYTKSELSHGENSMKGKDRHRVALVREIAEPLGFIVGLADLEHYLHGTADKDYSKRKRARLTDQSISASSDHDSDDEEDETSAISSQEKETLSMDRDSIVDTSTTISGLVDLNGNSLIDSRIELEESSEALLPKDPFENAQPDEQEYESYGDYYDGGSLKNYYRRTVMVLMHQSKQDDILFSAVDGIGYAIDKLAKSNSLTPTPEDKLWTSRIFDGSHSLNESEALTMTKYAQRWKDVNIWNTVAKHHGSSLHMLGGPDALFSAIATFGFGNLKGSFERILARTYDVESRLDFIISLLKSSVPSNDAEVSIWSKNELDNILASYSTENTASLMHIITVAGLETFKTTVAQRIFSGRAHYTFCIAFAKEMNQARQALIQNEARLLSEGLLPHSADAQQSINTLIQLSLTAAASHWVRKSKPTHPTFGSHVRSRAPEKAPEKRGDISRIWEIVGHCLDCDSARVCRGLFADMIKSADTPDDLLRNYIPLIQPLCHLLRQRKQDVTSSPFGEFMAIIIVHYLQTALGSKDEVVNIHLRKIGCGSSSCTDCKAPDVFMVDASQPTQTYRVVQTRRLHLEEQAQKAMDLCTFETIRSGSPYAVKITKRPKIFELCTWEARQRDARAFLAIVGGPDVLQKIMGTRFVDLQNAVAGIAPFVIPAPVPQLAQLAPPTNNAAQAQAADNSSLAGTKRKEGPHNRN